ncbi:MAG: zinc dependent phospholipase C family protein [Chloroflexota bacterium]
MPTPFTHLRIAQQLLSDPAIPAQHRKLLNAQRGAYLLGSVVADASVLAGLKRDETHFYSFDKPMEDHPWRVMLAKYPALQAASGNEWRAFLAGYVMHLSMDEIWSLHMTGPEFADGTWAPRPQRFVMLHILLIYMDERDKALLDPPLNEALRDAAPHCWLPFMSDEVLREWGSLIYGQVIPGGVSETLEIYGARIGKTPDELRAILDSPERMQADLWTHVTPETVARVEAQMLVHAREQMVMCLGEILLS